MDADKSAALNSPALLWFGPQQMLSEQAQLLFQKIFCPQQGCGSCIICNKITLKQHHAIAWFAPEKQYLVEQIDEILERLSLAQDLNHHFFIVLERAETLAPATANRLLKSLEEPPPGYHFLLLAERAYAVLPTIRSRCITKTWNAPAQISAHEPFIQLFMIQRINPTIFLAQLEETPIPESQALVVLDEILERWLLNRKLAVEQGQDAAHADRVIAALTKGLEQPPMPGSSKLFWKNLYLQATFPG
jgi:hypothetical protein